MAGDRDVDKDGLLPGMGNQGWGIRIINCFKDALGWLEIGKSARMNVYLGR